MSQALSSIINNIGDVTTKISQAFVEAVLEPKYIAGYKDGTVKTLSENLFVINTITLEEDGCITSITKVSDGTYMACARSKQGVFTLYKVNTETLQFESAVLPYEEAKDLHVTKLDSELLALTAHGARKCDLFDVSLMQITTSTKNHESSIYTDDSPVDVLLVNQDLFLTGDRNNIYLFDFKCNLIKSLERRKAEMPTGMVIMYPLLVELYSNEIDVWNLTEGVILYRVPCETNLSRLTQVGPYLCALRVDRLLNSVFVFDPKQEFKNTKTVEILLNGREKPPRMLHIQDTTAVLVGDEGIHLVDVEKDIQVREWTVLGHFKDNTTDKFAVKKHFVLDGNRLLILSADNETGENNLILFGLNELKIHYSEQEADTKLWCLVHM
ncbi:Mok [Acrasis kona]|uniref:Mok n=1 Tax=Acrasis kona TaxID=1008807 RepID=A0AAW2ZQI4_9EUKA